MTKLRWGIVSTGKIADQFCRDMQCVTNGILKAVAARNIESAQLFANKHNIEKAYQGYQALFNDPDIDVVYIATPHTLHFQNAYDALQAGKHVLCEKPITVNAKECLQLTKLAKEKGLFLMEAMWTYFLPAIIEAKAWVDEGRIGEIKHIKADFGYPMPYDSQSRAYNRKLAGGCLLDMGIYPIAIAQYFLTQPEISLKVTANAAENGVDNDVVMLVEYENAMATLASSFVCKLPNVAYIIGEKGIIVIPDFWRASECSLYKLDEKIDHFSDQRTSIGLNFEAQAVGEAISSHQYESLVVPHQVSLSFQKFMEKVKSQFSWHN